MKKIVIACTVLVLLLGCDSGKQATVTGPAAKPVAKPAQYDTGRTAFQRIYLSARMWSPDVQPFSLQSQYTPEAPGSEGKSGLWRAGFASPSRRMMKLFAWSGLVGPDAPEQGVSFSAEDAWSPTNTSTRPFDIAFLKIDSDKAYEVAQKHGGESLTRKDPHQPVFFLLSWEPARHQLIWHIVYGNNVDEAKLRIAVDATSGEFLRVEK